MLYTASCHWNNNNSHFFSSIYGESFVSRWLGGYLTFSSFRLGSSRFIFWADVSLTYSLLSTDKYPVPLCCCCCCCLYSGFSSLFAMHRQTRLSFNLHGRRGDKNEMRNFLLLVFSFSFLFRESPPCVCVCNIPPTNAAAWNRFILAVVSLGSTHVYAIHFLLLFRDFFCVRVN